MSIFQSSNPLDWAALDGIYIDEVTPPPSVVGVPTNIALLVGQFERGSGEIQTIGSVGELYQDYGNNIDYGGNVALQNKRFGSLKIIRVVASDANASTKDFLNSSSATAITFSALWKGAYGDNITVKIESGSTSGKKYTIHDGNENAVWPDETYDNLAIADIVDSTFANSNLIAATVGSTALEPSNVSATQLADGDDGSVADADYLDAITLSEVANSCNVIFLDEYNGTRNGYLKSTLANTQDKMAVLAGADDDEVSDAITDVANFRDTDGRMIYTFPWVYTTVVATSTLVNAASFYAALISQVPPNIDPAFAANSQYLGGITSLAQSLSRTDYINLSAAGISALEADSDIGIKIKSGVTTQIANSAKVMVFRRRMADFLMQSLAKFLKNYQNAPNSRDNQTKAGGGIVAFNRQLEFDGLVPKDSEVNTGKASVIDTRSLNTDDSIAQGYFKILYRRRIYSSMRYIVLQADISTSVVVTEVG